MLNYYLDNFFLVMIFEYFFLVLLNVLMKELPTIHNSFIIAMIQKDQIPFYHYNKDDIISISPFNPMHKKQSVS